jgi:hypothetical protein
MEALLYWRSAQEKVIHRNSNRRGYSRSRLQLRSLKEVNFKDQRKSFSGTYNYFVHVSTEKYHESCLAKCLA